jgi:hypothetical protein
MSINSNTLKKSIILLSIICVISIGVLIYISQSKQNPILEKNNLSGIMKTESALSSSSKSNSSTIALIKTTKVEDNLNKESSYTNTEYPNLKISFDNNKWKLEEEVYKRKGFDTRIDGLKLTSENGTIINIRINGGVSDGYAMPCYDKSKDLGEKFIGFYRFIEPNNVNKIDPTWYYFSRPDTEYYSISLVKDKVCAYGKNIKTRPVDSDYLTDISINAENISEYDTTEDVEQIIKNIQF